MQMIVDEVIKYIQDKALLEETDKVIVGVSGGADSMALLDILIRLGYDCICAHCNFHLRGEESNRDFEFVKNFCAEKKIKFTSIDFDTIAYMNQQGISLEMAARDLRYQWFEKIRSELDAKKIAVAHHQNDSVETVLINLIRGTGIRGLTGISPSNGNIVRPLLCLYQSDVSEYLETNHIPYVVDSTNGEDIYVRNKIRLQLIPLLESINPSVVQAISKTSENLYHTENIYNTYIKAATERIFVNNRIDIASLMEEDEPQTILFEILYPYGFNSDTISDIFYSINNQSGKTFYSSHYLLVKDRDSFILNILDKADDSVYYISEDTKEIEIPIKLSLKTLTYTPSTQIEKDKHIIYLDKSKLSYPLSLRRWLEGDKFVPFGMRGSKKVSDYFSDNKFSLIDKKNAWLLCSNDKIVWIVGQRADNRFGITDKTTEIIKIRLIH